MLIFELFFLRKLTIIPGVQNKEGFLDSYLFAVKPVYSTDVEELTLKWTQLSSELSGQLLVYLLDFF